MGLRVGLVLALALASASASGQDSPRTLFSRANVASTQGRFADARDLYRAALELGSNAAIAFNLAVALTRTGEFTEAVQVFDALLRDEYGSISPEQRREVAALSEEASREVATLVVRLPPTEGLEVRVDGQRVEGRHRLDPGEHIVSVQSRRHRPLEQRLVISRGETRDYAPTLQLRPHLTRGRLIVDAPDGGLLEVEGAGEAMNHLDLELEEGVYRVTLTSDERVHEREVEVAAGTSSRYEMSPSPPRRRAWLWVLAGVLVAGATTAVLALSLGSKPPREDEVYGTVTTLWAPISFE